MIHAKALLAFGLVWLSAQGGLAWLEVKKSCPDGCTEFGNCNHEFGTCECPFGRAGPACKEHLLGACRSSTDPKALPWYGIALPKSCECWRQILKIARNPARSVGYLLSVKALAGDVYTCYERTDVPEDQQLTDFPTLDDPNYRWGKPLISGSALSVTWNGPPSQLLFNSKGAGPEVVPLSRCPERCSERGVCINGHCQCMQSFAGPTCSAPDTQNLGCMNNCSGRGKCLAGFCHCPVGYWGQDCSRSKAYEPDPAVPLEASGSAYNRVDLRIYRYELPWNIAFPLGFQDTMFGINSLYSAFEKFYDSFSSDTVTRTENPHEANIFYVPLLDFYKDDNAGDPFEYTRRALYYLKETSPFWQRNQGKDHFLWLPGDLGACWLLNDAVVQNPIKVVHWGLQINASEYTHMPHYWWVKDQPVNKEYHCFKYEKDVVTPCWIDDKVKEVSHAEVVYQEALAGQKRRFLLFFGGGIRHQQFEYSGGARQAFDTHVVSKQHPEIKFGGGREAYKEATFCLAPYGDGWGSRLPHIMQAACIPVIVQEYVHQAFDDVLRYEDFSLIMRVEDIPRLVDTLKAVTPEQIQRYREKMYEVHKAFQWISGLGGQAYNYTLMSLKQKLYNLNMGLY